MFEYYYITIVRENAKLAIKMKILTYQGERYVETSRLRPNLPNINQEAATTISEFYNDIDFQVARINSQDWALDATSFDDALYHAIDNHIRIHNRLFVNDLLAYIDVNFHILEACNAFNEEQLRNIYSIRKNKATNKYLKYIIHTIDK